MESILFVTANRLPLADLVRFVTEMGGEWNDDPTLNHGVIRDGDAVVFINKPRAACTEYAEEELEELSKVLAGLPLELVSIDVGHMEKSLALACQIANAFIRRWGGMIDGNDLINSITE